jgi:hypothetical protein
MLKREEALASPRQGKTAALMPTLSKQLRATQPMLQAKTFSIPSAMGFGLELAFIRSIIDTEPGKRYVGQYMPTERNSPAAELFANAGFEKTSDTEWVLEPDSGGPAMPSWFEQS